MLQSMKDIAGAALAGMAVFAVPATAPAQSFPARPVTLVVPYGPGAATDIETRLYGQKLSEITGQSFITDYKPGAGTTIGTHSVAKSAPDGHTLLAVNAAFATSPALYENLPYDPIKDFSPVSLMSRRTTVIIASISAPFRNIAEYVAYAKANPGKVNLATAGAGGTTHINAAWFHNLTDTKVTFVHYKSASNSTTDMIAGRIDVIFTTATTAIPHLKAGKVKLLGLGNAERSSILPDALPAAEQGVRGYDYSSIFGFVGPAGISPAVLNQLAAYLSRVAKLPEVVKRLEADGGMAVGSTPAAFRDVLALEIARYRKIIQDNNIRLEE